ncbi:MAG: hypothetical protein K6G79_00920 [Bacteroidales bacterium]|nr:hypothetical protein [Bacteroidales bacterium]
MKQFLKDNAAYLAAAVIFIVLAFVYCKPVLSGKGLQANDEINGFSAVQESFRYTEETGDYTWWNNSVFSGMPNYQIGGGRYMADRLIGPFQKIFHRGPFHPAWIFIFYFVCFFLLMRTFGVEKWMSIVGAIAIALSSYFIVIIAAGHGGKTISIAYITLVAAGFYLIFRKRYALGAVFTMFFTTIGFYMHPQMAYYLFMMIGVFFLAELWIHIREKRWKDLGIATLIFAASLGIGLGTGTANIFANQEYARETMRGGHSDLVDENAAEASSEGLDLEYATAWSYGIGESLSFMIPGVMGGSSNVSLDDNSHTWQALAKIGVPASTTRSFCSNIPLYWGGQPFTAGNVYMGAIICFLFILGCLIVKGPYKWALLVSTLFSVALAWGSNFMWLTELFFKYFPMYNKFRAVSSILIVAEIAMPLLGFLAVKALTDGTVSGKPARKAILISAGVTGGICLVLALFGKSMFSFTGPYDSAFTSQLPEVVYNGILADRASLLVRDSWRSFGLIAAAAAALFLFNEKKLPYRWLVPVLGVLVLFDLWPVDRRYFNDSDFRTVSQNKSVYAMKPYEQQILQDPDKDFRVLNVTTNTFNDGRTSYYLQSVGGYHAAKLRRYQDLIDTYLSKGDIPVISMLNTKYFIVQGADGEPAVMLNPEAHGNAWFVGKLVEAENARAEMDALGQIDLHNTAVFDKSFAAQVPDTEPGIAPDAAVTLTDYTPKQLDYDCTSSTPGTVVFSEIYYPYGWKASIDGTPAEHFRVNYLLRAINVPAGNHHITFIFDPDSVRKGDRLATACILLMYVSILSLIVLAIIRKKREKKNVTA